MILTSVGEDPEIFITNAFGFVFWFGLWWFFFHANANFPLFSLLLISLFLSFFFRGKSKRRKKKGVKRIGYMLLKSLFVLIISLIMKIAYTF